MPGAKQGANQAIEDGMALATLLQDSSAADVPDVLARYQVLRRDRAAALQQSSRVDAERRGLVKPSLNAGTGLVLDYDVEEAARVLRAHA